MARRSAARCLAEMSVELPLNSRVSELARPARRLTMFAHAVHAKSKVIIVDEPTAGLDEHDAETVVSELEKLRSPERAIIFVSHRFPEVVRLCDRVTVIRDGRDICTLEREDVTTRALSELILAPGEEQAAGADSGERVTGHIALSAHGLHGRHLRDVSLDLRRGEILGLAGLAESGAEELMDVLGGDKRVTAGRLAVNGAEVALRSPSDAVAGGIVYLPSERSRAVLADDPVRVNVAMPRWGAISPRRPGDGRDGTPVRDRRAGAAAADAVLRPAARLAVRREPAEGPDRPRRAGGGPDPDPGQPHRGR